MNNTYIQTKEDHDNYELLKSIIAKTDSNLAKCCRTLHSRKLKYLEEWLNKKIAKLQDKQYTFKTKLFWLFNNILDFPVCCICGKKVVGINVKTFRHGYGKNVHCSRACAQRHAAEHAKKTNLEKYGVEFSFQSENNKTKSKATCLKKYGVEHGCQSQQIQDKIRTTRLKNGNGKFVTEYQLEKCRQTCLMRYGVEHYQSTKECEDKKKKTCMARFGVEYAAQSQQAKDAYKKTCQEKFGADTYLMTDEFKKKAEQTCLEKYGVRNVLCAGTEQRLKAEHTKIERYGDKNYNNKEQTARTCQQKYGAKCVFSSKDIRESTRMRALHAHYDELLKNKHVVPLFSFDEYEAKTAQSVLKWKCLECGMEFSTKIDWNFGSLDGERVLARCEKCHPLGNNGTSREEQEFIKKIQSMHSGEVVSRARVLKDGTDKRFWKEIDCYLPSLKIGFEYDGLYFHQVESQRDGELRHLHKTQLAENRG